MKAKSKLPSYLLIMMAYAFILIGCKKKDQAPAPMQTGTVTDIDNNTYKTVKIGNQWWMAENLNVKRYHNGAPIKQVTYTDPDSLWAQKTTGAFCLFQYTPNIDTTYGSLYNWYAATDTNNIAPAGWHVPTDNDWKILEEYLGMNSIDADKVNWRGTDEGEKLKKASQQDWTYFEGVWPTNESGFSALAGGCRLFNSIWSDPGLKSVGFWWTSTPHSSNNQAWFRNLDYKKSNIFRYYVPKSYGMSIRCVKD